MGYSITVMNDLTFKVLRTISDGCFHSGELLARELGVSRSSVWHAVHKLTAAGVTVYRVPGRGYRLPQPLSLLDAGAITCALGRDAGFFDIEVLGRAPSTNTLLLRAAAAGARHGTVIAAEWQEGGRGRRGRPWLMPVCGGLAFSLLWRFDRGAGALSGLSLAAGIAVMRALDAMGVTGITLKWPNDLLWRGGKLAGLLIEMQGEALGPSAVVLGVGVNVRLPAGMQERIGQPVADLETACGHPVDRSALLASMLRELRQVLEKFVHDGFAPLRSPWEARHSHQGRRVTLLLPDGSYEVGVAAGVDDSGALLLATAAGMQRYHSGEVSLRAAKEGAL